MKTIIYADQAPDPIGPYSQANLVNGVLYVSGQIAIDKASGNIIDSTIEEETDRVMKNLKFILEAANTDFDHVVKCTIFIKDMNDFGRINEVYGKYVGKTPPARETVEVSGLPKNVNVEISCIAHL